MDYNLATIKPQTPYCSYMGQRCIADRQQVVISGWDKCGLLTPFKPQFRAEALAKAKAVAVDLEHQYYPLFPSILPPGDAS
jgi:hypothetical protein